jgi:hypothetical protein
LTNFLVFKIKERKGGIINNGQGNFGEYLEEFWDGASGRGF